MVQDGDMILEKGGVVRWEKGGGERGGGAGDLLLTSIFASRQGVKTAIMGVNQL